MKSMSFRTDDPVVAGHVITTKPIFEEMTTGVQGDEVMFFIENPSKEALLWVKKIATDNPGSVFGVTYKLS